MNNKEKDEKFLKSWLKKKISITTSTVVSFLITGAAGGGIAYGAIPEGTKRYGNYGVAAGTSSLAEHNAVAVGLGAQAKETESAVAVGVRAKADAAPWDYGKPGRPDPRNIGGIAIGSDSYTKSGVSIGTKSNSTEFGIALGYRAGARSSTVTNSLNNITIGANTRVGIEDKDNPNRKSAGQGIAIGGGTQDDEGAWARGDQSIAIGSNTIAYGDSSIVIGGDDIDRAAGSTKSYIKKSYDKNGTETSTAVNNQSLNDIYKDLTGRTEGLKGYDGTKAGEASIALGVKAKAGDIATALGTMAEAIEINSLALGTGARATQVNSVAIGGGSTTENIQGRKITDANMVLSDGTNVNFGNFAGAAGVEEGDIVSFGRIGSERQLKHIAPGEISATSTDAINGSQLFSVARKLGSDISKLNTDISKFKYVSINSNDAGNKLNDGATENNAIAIGPNASTKVASAISLGDGANVTTGPTKDKDGKTLQPVMSSGSGVAIGKSASAVQAGIAIGDTSSTVTSGVAIGREAKVSNDYRENHGSYTKGQTQDGFFVYDRIQNNDNLKYSNTETTDSNAYSPGRYNGQGIAIGYKSDANTAGISLGNSATSKYGALALGNFAKAEGDTSTAIGIGAYASGARGISMGRQASATTQDSVAIGTGARGGSSSAGGSVAVGGGAAATGTQAIAIGGLYGNDLYSSSATTDGSGNLTKNTQASGEASIAMGVNTKAVGKQALAMGASAQATKEAALAVGVNAVSNNGIAIGKNSTSGGNSSSSIALGTNATSNFGGIAIGESATANSQSIVIGAETRSGRATKAVIIGDGAGVGSAAGTNAPADYSIAIGRNAGKESEGRNSSFNLANTIAIGANSKIGDTNKKVSQSIAIGGAADNNTITNGTWARGDQSIAIGADVEATGDSSIAIGGDDLDSVASSNSSYEKKIFDKNGNQVGSTVTVSKNLNQMFSSLTGRGELLNFQGTSSIDGRSYRFKLSCYRYRGSSTSS